MPEADRFERKLPLHWRVAYRTARTGREDLGLVVDCVMPAIRETLLRYATPDGIVEVFELLAEIVTAANGAQQSLLDWTEHIARLESSLDAVADRREEELCVAAVARAALLAYARLKEECATDRDRIRDMFAEAFGTVLIENQFLARVRDGLMSAAGCDLDAQTAWQDELLATLHPQMRAFFRTLINNKRIPRVPPRLTRPMEITRESLSQPLDLSGGMSD